ncbi:MAG: 50S ribosomal protein L10 [Thermodesulfobacterium sp.]|nr:50S ribosomal protein L10 [Thermodesulfobacterium sp.]
MKTRAKKAEILKSFEEKLEKANALFVLSYKGFTAYESNEIRKLVREKGGEFRVVKNTLLRIASEKKGKQVVNDYVEGPTAVVFTYQDPVEIAKVLKEYIKTHPSLTLRGLVLQDKGYDTAMVDELVKLPPKEVLIAQLLGTIQAPVANFVGVLSAILRNFLYVLKAIEEKKAKGEA